MSLYFPFATVIHARVMPGVSPFAPRPGTSRWIDLNCFLIHSVAAGNGHSQRRLMYWYRSAQVHAAIAKVNLPCIPEE